MIRAIILFLSITCFVQGGEKEQTQRVFGDLKITGFKSSSEDEEVMTHTFEGNQIIVRIGDLTLTCDRIVVQLGDKKKPKAFLATSKKVAADFKGLEGETKIGICTTLTWIAKSGDVELTGGPPTLKMGLMFISPAAKKSAILLRKNGKHEINPSATQDSIDIQISLGKKSNSPPGDLQKVSRSKAAK